MENRGARRSGPAKPQDSIIQISRVIGIDPGSATTGYGVIDHEKGRLQLVEYGGISSSPRLTNFAERLLVISQKLEEILDRLKPDSCAVEETFYAVNIKTALKLGHVRGAVLVAAARKGIPVYEYSPLEIKSALVGYGRAEKRQVQEMVRLLLNLKAPPEPLDAADALATAICHVHTIGTQSRYSGGSAEISNPPKR